MLLICFRSWSQTEEPETIRIKLASTKNDTATFTLLKKLRDYYVERNFDSALYYGYQLMNYAEKTKKPRDKIEAYQSIGYTYGTAGNITGAMEMIIEAKKLAELEEDKEVLGSCFHLLGNLHASQGNYEEAISFFKQAAENVKPPSPTTFTYTSLMNIGNTYRRMKMLDSALHYEQRAYESALKQDKRYFPHVLHNLGMIHRDLGHTELALYYFRAGIAEAQKQGLPGRVTSGLYESLSKFFQTSGNRDSALYFARASINAVEGTPFKYNIVSAYTHLSELHTGNGDSAYKYLKAATDLKNSLNITENATQFQALRYQEELREKERQTKQERNEKQRKQNMQYAAVGGGVLGLLMIFLLLSRSIIVTERFIKFLGVIVLLVVFEFINLFLHPYLGAWTHHSPVWMLLIMVAIAGVLVPIHHRMEHWMTHQMVEKNKKIRIAAARKTLAKLEA